MYSGCIEVLGDPEELNILFKALYPERSGGKRYRSRVDIELGKEALRICVHSSSLASFRAAVNTFLRILSMILEILWYF